MTYTDTPASLARDLVRLDGMIVQAQLRYDYRGVDQLTAQRDKLRERRSSMLRLQWAERRWAQRDVG